MVRSKLSLKLIDDKRRRNATFMKRRAGLKKKAMELSLLCDVPILLVCFGPEGQAEVWPEDRRVAYGIIDRFHSASAEDRGKRKYDVSTFFGEAVMKQAATESGASGKEEGDLRYPSEEQLILDLMPKSSLEELEWALEARLKAIEERMGALQGEAPLQEGSGGEQPGSAQLGWHQPEQAHLQYYHLTVTTPQGEEMFAEGIDGYWENPNGGGGLDEDPAALLSSLHQDLLTHGGAAPPLPPPAYNSTSFPVPCYQTYGDNMGTASYLQCASMACIPHLPAAALAGYPYHPDGYVTLPYLNAPKMGLAAPASPMAFMPPRPSSAFLDYNGASGGSALCAMNCCSFRCPVLMSGNAVFPGRAGRCGGGAREQVASSRSSSNGEGVHHLRGEHYGDALGFPVLDEPIEDGLENTWGSSIYPAHPSGAIPAAPLAVDGSWAGFAGGY